MRVLVTGIKPYLARLSPQWADHSARRFSVFEPIRTKSEVIAATRFNGNTGNYLIGEGAVEAIGRDRATYVIFGYLHAKTRDPEYLAAIKSQFDCVVLVTANMLRSDYDAASEAELFARLDLPTVVLGIGCQRNRDLAQDIPAGTLRFLEVLRSREHHVFTRGAATADYLRARGLRQVWATGCPSMFLRPENIAAAVADLRRIDWRSSLNIAFCGYLARDPAAVHDITLFGNRNDNCNYVLQDEHLSYNLEFEAADGDPIYNDMSGEVTRVRAFRGSESIKDVRLRLFFNTHQWRAMMAMHDASIGRRFHGIVAALQAGIPGLMIAVDDRMREMISQLELPYVEMAEWIAADDKLALLESTVAGFDFDRWRDRYSDSAALFRSRLASLGFG